MGADNVFPEDPYKNCFIFGAAIFMYCVSMIPYCMALSTFFSDPRLANLSAGLLLMVPQLFFLWLTSQSDGQKYFVYTLFLFPVVPACSIFVDLSINRSPEALEYNLVNLDFISIPLCWAVLFLLIPFWLLVYLYLEQVMPSEWGVRKGMCFCCTRRQKKGQN